MEITAGFLVVLFVALCVVVMPSVFIAMKLWNSGSRGRAWLAFSCLVLAFFGLGAFSPDPQPRAGSLELRVTIFMTLWGSFLYLSLGLAAIWAVISRLAKRLQNGR